MPSLNQYTAPTDPPSFYEVLQAAKDAGLVGEEDTVLTLVLAMIRGGLIVMTGPSRAGKDEAVDAAESVFNAGQTVYRWPTDDSPTSAFYNRNTINRYPIHRFPDLARLQEHHEKVLKAFGEGRDAERIFTDVSNAEGEEAEEQVLRCPKTTIAFIASDNENVDLNDYPELRNRALILSVDASAQQTARVNRKKAEQHAGRDERNVDPMRTAEIQSYHSSIPVDEWTDSPNAEIINPAALEIHEQEPIPQMFPEARQDFDRLLSFMETVTLYHYSDRLVHEVDGVRRMFTTPADVWEAMTILGNRMVMSALNLKKEDRAVLSLLDEAHSNLTKAEIQQSLRAQGYHITDRDVKRSLDSMRVKGYVRVHQGSPNTFSFNEFGKVVKHDAGLNYTDVVEAARNGVYEVLPDDQADLYVEQFCEGDGLFVTHPFTGEAVDIRERDDLDEMMDDGMEDIEDTFEDDSGDTNDDSGSGESASQLQGTLT